MDSLCFEDLEPGLSGRDSVQGAPWLEIRGIERTVSMERESQGIRTAVTGGDSSLLDPDAEGFEGWINR